jgi:hypothetical protein
VIPGRNGPTLPILSQSHGGLQNSSYETEKSPAVRELLVELGELGVPLGTNFDLDETTTCYFLLLGQSLAVKILPSKERTETEGDDQ